MIRIKRGLDVPITGAPNSQIEEGPQIRSVAVIGSDYVGMKPTMSVREGDVVKKGQLLFTDKKTEGVRYTSPASGRIASVNRGHKRALLSVVIDVEGDEEETFKSWSATELASLERQAVVDNLVESGLWTALRTRPFSKVPGLDGVPGAIFVTAIDTDPFGFNPQLVINDHKEDFKNGLEVLGHLTEGKLYVCQGEGGSIPVSGKAQLETFAGKHPAGLAGTHIHFLDPVSANKSVWFLNYQDVIAIGKLFTTGKINVDRVVAFAGPQVETPRLIKTRLGASLDELAAGQTKKGENRIISGSVLSGRTARGALAYLGRYHNHVSILREGRERQLLEYMWPGKEKHSVMNIFLSRLTPNKRFSFTTTANGSARAMVPVGAYEEVMPLDILPTQLLRSLIVGDTETAQTLGCLELDEEDLALCTYVCPGKYEYGTILRENLTRIEKEG